MSQKQFLIFLVSFLCGMVIINCVLYRVNIFNLGGQLADNAKYAFTPPVYLPPSQYDKSNDSRYYDCTFEGYKYAAGQSVMASQRWCLKSERKKKK